MSPVYLQFLTVCLGVIASAIVAGIVHLGRKLNRIASAFDDFPPHRHVNGSIIYPKEFEPTEIERLSIKVT